MYGSYNKSRKFAKKGYKNKGWKSNYSKSGKRKVKCVVKTYYR